jgi:hypothetical protein
MLGSDIGQVTGCPARGLSWSSLVSMGVCCDRPWPPLTKSIHIHKELSHFATDSVIQSVLVSSLSATPDQILAAGKTVMGFMSWGVFPEWRTCLPSLPDPLLESPSLDPLWSFLCSTLYWSLHLTLPGIFFTWPYLESSLLGPPWGNLHLTLPGVFLARPSTGIFLAWPSLESPLLDPPWSLLGLTLYWRLLHLTLPGVFFIWLSLESASLDPPWSLLYLTLPGVFFTWPSLESSSRDPHKHLISH